MTDPTSPAAPAQPEKAARQPSRAAGLAALARLLEGEETARAALGRGEPAVAWLSADELDDAAAYVRWLQRPVADTGPAGEEETLFDAALAFARELVTMAEQVGVDHLSPEQLRRFPFALRELHDALAVEREAVRDAVAVLEAQLEDLKTVGFKELHLEENGALRARLAGACVQYVAQAFTAYFLEQGAKNVVELTYTAPGFPGEFFTVTVQRCPGKTPMMLLAEEKAARDAEVTREREAYARLVAQVVEASGVDVGAGGATALDVVRRLRTELDGARARLAWLAEKLYLRVDFAAWKLTTALRVTDHGRSFGHAMRVQNPPQPGDDPRTIDVAIGCAIAAEVDAAREGREEAPPA